MVKLSIQAGAWEAPGPLYLKLKDEILRQIRLGGLRPGDRLPPTRQLAGDLGLNRGTVSAAYEELTSEGVLTSHVGRGTFVAPDLSLAGVDASVSGNGYRWADHFAGAEPPPPPWFPTAPAGADVIAFHRGVPDQALFPADAFRAALDATLREEGEHILGYAPAEGHPPFVDFLLDYLRVHRSLAVTRDEVLVVNGSQQAMDLLARTFLRPGDTVAVEDPSYFGALELFRSAGARMVAIPMDESGMRLEEAESVLARERPKFVYIMPTYQNPTGRCLSTDRREGFIRLAARYEVPVIEDDFDAELAYDREPPPPLKSLPGSQGVIYIGTPSKTLFPGLRIGWIVADPAVTARVGRIKQIADLSGSQLLQAAFTRFAKTGAYDEHKDRVRKTYRRRRDAVLAALQDAMPRGVSWTRPGGGMSLLVTLPDGMDSEAILAETAAEGVLFSPGSWFHVNDGARSLRLCFGSVTEADADRGARILARTVARHLDAGRKNRPPSRVSRLPAV